MDWSQHLQPDETLRWQGRPAPRCYTFRNWRHSIFGLLLLVFSLLWMYNGAQLAGDVSLGVWRYLPVPVVALGAYLAFGHLVQARLQWEGLFFAITDRRVLLLKKKRLSGCDLSQLSYVILRPLGRALGTLHVYAGDGTRPLRLCCIEQPQQPLDLLARAVEVNERSNP